MTEMVFWEKQKYMFVWHLQLNIQYGRPNTRYLKRLYTNNYMLILKTQTCSLKVNKASVKAISVWHL